MSLEKTTDLNSDPYLDFEETFDGLIAKYHGPLPSVSQVNYLKEECGAFLHFGMNTYTEVEWGNGKESLDDFTLAHFDYESYVKTLKDLGFRRLIFTAKHHDGFCMWDTKETSHKITNTSYGKDFLYELSKACSKFDMDMGIYLSPWDVHEPSYGSGDLYNEFYINQIKEIVNNPIYGNKGHFVEWWFDNAKDENYPDQEYDFEKFMAEIRKNNPNILFFGVGAKGGIHWAGNERGFAPSENAPRLKKDIFEIDYDADFRSAVGHNEDYVFSISECDTSVTDRWFSHKDERIKSVEELFEIYLKSVGRGGVLLLNIPANKSGKIDGKIIERLRETKEKIQDSFSKNIVDDIFITCTDMGNEYFLEVENPNDIDINFLVVREDIRKGSRFTHGYIFINEERFNIDSIGDRRIFDLRSYENIDKIRLALYGESKLYINDFKIY